MRLESWRHKVNLMSPRLSAYRRGIIFLYEYRYGLLEGDWSNDSKESRDD
jgi:hypothetical protein